MPVYRRTVAIKGLEEAKRLLQEFRADVPTNAVTALEQIGERVVDEMQFNCPVDTGLLQSEIQITESGQDHVTIESPTAYAGFVNFGTTRQSPQPYFTDAIENLSSFDAVETIEDVVVDIWNDAVSRNLPR